jgi:hypothetical protein
MIPLLVALAAAPAVQADVAATPGTPLWDRARVGMTPAQVQAAFPTARPVVNGESLLDNAKERFRLEGVRLPNGGRATASFYFRGDSLNEVKLVADVPSGQTQANVRRAVAIANALKPIYGKPTTCGPREGLLAFECDWVSHGLSVSVTYMDVAGESPLLETAIRGIVASDAQVPRSGPTTKSAPTTGQPPGPGGE